VKELTKKVLEAGLVEKHTARMFEQWGHLDRGSADLVGQQKVTAETLEAFVEDIDKLIEKSSEVHETALDINVTAEFDFEDDAGKKVHAYVDYMGYLLVLVGQRMKIHRGSKIRQDGKTFAVLDIEPFYQNDEMVALRLTVSKPD
jgi:hypothetical protein